MDSGQKAASICQADAIRFPVRETRLASRHFRQRRARIYRSGFLLHSFALRSARTFDGKPEVDPWRIDLRPVSSASRGRPSVCLTGIDEGILVERERIKRATVADRRLQHQAA